MKYNLIQANSRQIKSDLTNKFVYLNFKEVPNLQRVCLNFGLKNPDSLELAKTALALELISGEKAKLTKVRNRNLGLKVKKGQPTGCVATLKNGRLKSFFSSLAFEASPKTSNFGKRLRQNPLQEACRSATFTMVKLDVFFFEGLEQNQHFFKGLPSLNITFSFNKNICRAQQATLLNPAICCAF